MLRMVCQALTGTDLVHKYPYRCTDMLRAVAIRRLPQYLVDILQVDFAVPLKLD